MSKSLLLVFILAASAVIMSGCGATEEEEAFETVVPVEVYTVQKGLLTEKILYVGDVRGRKQVDVYPKVGGRLAGYEAKEGDFVEKNAVIALIDRDVTGYDFAPAPLESPIAGTVVKTYLDPGDFVSPSAVLAVVADTEEVIVRISVAEKDYPFIEHGQEASALVDAYPGRVFRGRLTRLSRMLDPMTRTASAEITIRNEHKLLVPGMFARVELITGERKALLAPRDAVVRRPGTGSYYCFTVNGGKAARVRVRTGGSSGDYTEILSGLKQGDVVVVSGHGSLETGSAVEIAEGL